MDSAAVLIMACTQVIQVMEAKLVRGAILDGDEWVTYRQCLRYIEQMCRYTADVLEKNPPADHDTPPP